MKLSGRLAGGLFLLISVVLALLLLGDLIGPVTSGSIFAVALVVLGLLSGGFRRR